MGLLTISEWWHQLLQWSSENPWTLLSYLSMPIIAAVVGWGTNVLALKMTFYPIKFLGIEVVQLVNPIGWGRNNPRIGWQGIIPAKAEIMAEKSVDLITGKLVKVDEQFAKIDPERVADEMRPALVDLSRSIIHDAMEANAPLVWRMMPDRQKERIYRQAEEQLPHATQEIMADIRDHILELFDVKKMVVGSLTKDKKLLNDIFLTCGEKEFRFIEQSGAYFGFLFGIIQTLVYIQYPYWWELPLGGLLVGYITNWLAIYLIFNPLHPIKVGPFVIQGMFIKRQEEVATAYAKLVSENILTPKNIFENILHGSSSEKLVNIVRNHVQEAIDKTAGFNRSLIQISSGTRAYESIKGVAVERFMEALPESIHHIFGYAEEALDMENTLNDKMASLPPEDFVGVLRPAYQEDEWKLILVGAILGAIAGFFQILIT